MVRPLSLGSEELISMLGVCDGDLTLCCYAPITSTDYRKRRACRPTETEAKRYGTLHPSCTDSDSTLLYQSQIAIAILMTMRAIRTNNAPLQGDAARHRCRTLRSPGVAWGRDSGWPCARNATHASLPPPVVRSFSAFSHTESRILAALLHCFQKPSMRRGFS